MFMSEEKMAWEMYKQIGVDIMQILHGSVVAKVELSQKARLSIYQSGYVPTLYVSWLKNGNSEYKLLKLLVSRNFLRDSMRSSAMQTRHREVALSSTSRRII